MIYLICFAVSTLFAFWGQKIKSRNGKIIFITLSIAITVLLAGLRDIYVGIDTSHYYENLWTEALKKPSTWSFLKSYHKYYPSKEYLYALLLGASAQLTGNFHVFLTLVHLIVIGGIYIGAFRLKKYASPAFIVLLFYLFYYNHSLNIIRQYMAMAIIFAALPDLLNRKYKRYLVAVFIGVMFHNSSIMGIMPMILFMLLYPKRRLRKVPQQRRMVVYSVIVAGVILFKPMMRILITIGVLSSKYLHYLEKDGFNNYTVARVLSFLGILGILLYLRLFRTYDKRADFFLVSSITFCILYQFAVSIPYGRRIAIYFAFINLTSLGLLVQCQKHRSNAWSLRIVIVLGALAYWLLMYGYLNTSGTLPYVLGV